MWDRAASRRAPWPTEHFPFQSRYVDVDGHRIHYVDEGKGPVLLFLHPAPAAAFMYREFIAALRERFRCVALDYPGFGLSVARSDSLLTLEEYAGAVAGFVDAVDLRAITLVLHDAGGPIGFRAAAMARAHGAPVRVDLCRRACPQPSAQPAAAARVDRCARSPAPAARSPSHISRPVSHARIA